jgi:O-antigen ligase
MAGLMLLPGALIVFMGFNSGGNFPQTPALAAIVLAQVLLVRIMQSRDPFEGFAPSTVAAVGALGLYALMSLISGTWSHSTSRALIEFDRAWMYLLILILYGTVRPSRDNLRWLIRGLVIGATVVCVAGLISRVLPDLWHTPPDVANQRLSFPVTYWNALGLLAAVGVLLAFHMTSDLGESRAARVLAAPVIPVLAATLFFTFSRGAIATGVVGLVIYVLVGRPRAFLSGAIATVPATAILVVVAYHANLLDTSDPTTPAAVVQGHHVAVAAGICAVACVVLRLLCAVRLDPLLRARGGRAWMRSATRNASVVGAVVTIIAVGLALGAPHTISHDWHRFFNGAPTGEKGDLRQRLTDPSDNGRTELWTVALHAFSRSPLHGYGAGTYDILWDRNRPVFDFTVNAHSLYLQAMAELGIPGLVLLLVLVGAVLVGLGVRARGSRRTPYGALLAAAVVWALAAGVDWDWEMPVVTVGFFAAAGLGLAPRRGARSVWLPAANSRMVLGFLCLFSIVAPVLIIASQFRLDAAERSLYVAKNCAKASSAALDSIKWLDVRPEPYEILGFCDIERGEPRVAIAAMKEAVSVDPGSWEPYYTLALAKAAAGVDPRADAARAYALSPLEPLTSKEVKAFKTKIPAGWVNQSTAVQAEALASSDLSIVPS